CGKLPDVPITARHFIKRPLRTPSIAIPCEICCRGNHHLAGLNQWRNQKTGWRVVTGGRPVVAACARWACIHLFPERFVNDVVPVRWFARDGIELRPDILENGFLVAKIFAGFPVELPQNAVLTDREKQILAAGIDKYPFEHDVEIERFTRSMLE